METGQRRGGGDAGDARLMGRLLMSTRGHVTFTRSCAEAMRLCLVQLLYLLRESAAFRAKRAHV